MDESLRTLEQKALRNVRTLVETLEREELRKRKRQKYLVAAGILPLALVFAAVALLKRPATTGITASQACELDAWSSRASEFRRNLQKSEPQLSSPEIEERLRRERPALMAAAHADCASKAR